MSAPPQTAPPAEHHEGTVPLPQPLKQKIKDGIVALSLANLCFANAWFTILYDTDWGYFNQLPIRTPSTLALLINIIWLTATVWLGMRVWRRFQNRRLHFVLHLAFLGLLLIPADFVRIQIFHIYDHQVMVFLRRPMVMFCSLVLLALVVWQHRRVARVAGVLLMILSPLALLTLAKIGLLLLGVVHLKQAEYEPVLPPPAPVHEGRPRVIWIIFDCTDYRVAFENRPDGVQLPEFDRLRGESLFCVNACSPNNCTISSMPALISGRRISGVGVANASDLNIRLADTEADTTWQKLPSVFAEARALGANTALVGWYHPYDRILGKGLNYCAWYPFPLFEPARAKTIASAMRREIGCIPWVFHIHRIYISVCQDSLRESLSLVTNQVYGLTLLHLPPPHTPGVYLPEKDQFTFWGMPRIAGYLGNLALADKELGQMRRAMETSGQWDKTWLIISTDHSLGQGSFGGYDIRVPFIVKPPGANEPITYSPKFNTILTHDLILAVLRGEIASQQELVPWLDEHGKPLPTLNVGKQE
ncbi:MAG: sulfatase-like hydrolase/transferase [Verrucomicrobiota bacterium]